MSTTAMNYVPIKKHLSKVNPRTERTDDSIAKVWSKTGSLSYHYTDLWAEVKLPRNIQINLGLKILHRLLPVLLHRL